MELNAVLVLHSHKADSGSGRVVQETSLRRAALHFHRLAVSFMSHPQGQKPPQSEHPLSVKGNEEGTPVVPRVIAINFEISPLYAKSAYTTCLSCPCFNSKCCWHEAKQSPVESLVLGYQWVGTTVHTL